MISADDLNYSALADAMGRAGLPYSPAEAHGIACGMLVAHLPEVDRVWAAEAYAEFEPNDVLAEECRFLMDHMFAATQSQLTEMEFEFQLFLPEDGKSLAQRTQGLADWCQGYLFGLGLAGEELLQQLSEESQEGMQDIAELSRMDTDDIADDEADEEAVFEIEEYLRVATMLMYNDLELTGELQNERE